MAAGMAGVLSIYTSLKRNSWGNGYGTGDKTMGVLEILSKLIKFTLNERTTRIIVA